MKNRTKKEIIANINRLRRDLGLDTRSYPKHTVAQLEVIEANIVGLTYDWNSDDGADNICAMHYTDIAAQYGISEFDAKAFYDNVVN